MEFKKLELKQEGNWFKRLINSKHFRKSIIYIALGAIIGFIFTYITEGKSFSQIPLDEFYRSMFTGAFFGFFITNSPCARNKC